MAIVELGNHTLTVRIDSKGAELAGLELVGAEPDATGHPGQQLLWQGGAAWGRRAPVLFPIIGRMPGDILVHDSVAYPIFQHGFARDLEFAVDRISDTEVAFTLEHSAQTLIHFPFAFRLEVRFELVDATVRVIQTVSNLATEPFSASLGAHPGFAWPLPGASGRTEHSIEFDLPETAPIRRIANGLLKAERFSNPIVGSTLSLDESIFAADAVIFDSLSSRSVRYSAPGAPSITVSFPDFPILGVWSKAPGEFVCIEPWFGMTAAEGFSGEYSEKPHQFVLQPHGSREFTYSVSVARP
ncbi:aldose 1-epimerase family protein [Lacisediminihabitans sp. FW035]